MDWREAGMETWESWCLLFSWDQRWQSGRLAWHKRSKRERDVCGKFSSDEGKRNTWVGSKEYEGSFPQAPFSEMATKWDCSCKVCFQHSIQSDSPKNRCWLLLLLQTLRFTDCETGACCSHCSLLDLMRIGSHHSFYNPSNHNTQWANLRLEKVICSLTNDLIRQDKSKKKKIHRSYWARNKITFLL